MDGSLLSARDDVAKIINPSYYSAFLLDFTEIYLSLRIEIDSGLFEDTAIGAEVCK